MFDNDLASLAADGTTADARAGDDSAADGRAADGPAAGPSGVPLERLEAQICELAGHLAAATCRFLVLLGDFDARRAGRRGR